MGVAVSPGSLPESGKPTFELADDEIEIGMGAHGEKGVKRQKLTTADDIVDQMMATPPDDQEAMIALFQQAMRIWLPDLPVIPIVQAPALVPFNSTYWSNWPTAENAWNMPVSWWANFDLVLGGLPNAETGQWEGGVQPAAAS